MSADPPFDPIAARKRELRAAARARRRARPHPERLAASLAIERHGIELAERMGTGAIACFLSTASEPGTRPLIEALRERGRRVLLPRPLDGNRLAWVEAGGGERQHELGVPEPLGPALGPDALRDAALVLVPAAAVDARGARLGWGGGFYDRALAERRTGSPVVAVVFDDDIVTSVPLEHHDAHVDGVLTPRGFTPATRSS